MNYKNQSELPAWYCPNHKKPLKHVKKHLTCPVGDSFLVRNAIPRFVPESSYADAFGEQWNHFRLTQLDSYTKTNISRVRIRRCFGKELWENLSGKSVLECGCGAGRFTETLLREGAQVISIDLSNAVEANLENFPVNEFHRIAQANINSLPFSPQQFDIVVCLGVIQHTPNPELTIASLFEQVKPGGMLVIDQNTYSFSWYTKTASLLGFGFRHLSPKQGMKWTERLVKFFLPIHKAVRNFYPAQMLLSRLSPVLCYYRAFPELNDQLQKEWAFLDTHDSLTAWYRRHRTRRQIRQTLESLGLENIYCEYGGNGVEARGKRPLN